MLFHVAELIKKVIDPEFQMEAQDRDAFFECFYNYYYPWLLNPLQVSLHLITARLVLFFS